MNVAKEALAEFFKELSKGLIQSAPNMSFEFTRNESKVSLVISDSEFSSVSAAGSNNSPLEKAL